MGYGHRFFLFPNDGSMRRLSVKLVGDLALGRTVLTEYAGKDIRMAEVRLELEGRRPVRILAVDATIWYFDEAGDARQSLAESGMEARITHDDLGRERQQKGKVAHVTARIARRRWEEKYRWEPTQEDITRIVEAIWKPGAKAKG